MGARSVIFFFVFPRGPVRVGRGYTIRTVPNKKNKKDEKKEKRKNLKKKPSNIYKIVACEIYCENNAKSKHGKRAAFPEPRG